MATFEEHKAIQVVELHMMDKRKYFPLAIASGFAVRGMLYPFSLIKTRIQIQKKKAYYHGTFDAFRKITHAEGVRGLYKGFWVSNLLVIPQLAYISTYEGTRHFLGNHTTVTSNKLRSFISGGCASMAGQTFIVPIDIVSQHLMMLSTPNKKNPDTSMSKSRKMHSFEISQEALDSRMGRTKAVILEVYRRNGLKGFYKGYFTSLSVYAPNSAMWWFFYDFYTGIIADSVPDWVPRLMIQCSAAPLGGVTAALITNPLDIIRARIQVENTKFADTARNLWKEEQLRMFNKGLSARLVQSVMFSFFVILGYESIKRMSLLEEYKDSVRW